MTLSAPLASNPAFPRHQRLAAHISTLLPAAELAHDALHIERVYAWALRLAREMEADGDLAGAAALVHDCVSIPKDAPERSLGGERSAALAGHLLPPAGYSQTECELIVEAVRTCSFSRGLAPSGVLGMILQDADRLDALGVTGLLRSATCAQDMAPRTQGRLYDAQDPAGSAGRALDDRMAMLDHLECKLLHLAAHLHCPSARVEGARRHASLIALRNELLHELAGIHPAISGDYQGLLFDFDGTLVDSQKAIIAALRQAAAAVAMPLGPEDAPLRALIGRPLIESFSEWGLSEVQSQSAVAAYRQAWQEGLHAQCELFPGVMSTLRILRERGCRLVLATAKGQDRVHQAVARHGLDELLHESIGSLPGERDKSGVVARAGQAAGVNRVALIGDRCFDAQAAAVNKLPFFAACWGYASHDELTAGKPQGYLGHISDCLSLVAEGLPKDH